MSGDVVLATKPQAERPSRRIDAAWLGAIPIVGWMLAYAHEAGHYLRHDVPLVFIELSLTQVLKATVGLLISIFLSAQLIEIIRKIRQRRAFGVVLVALVVVATVGLVYFAKSEDRFRLVISGIMGTIAILMMLYLAWTPAPLLRYAVLELQLFPSSPTLSRFVNVLGLVFILGIFAVYTGYKGSWSSSVEPIVLDRECGPLSELVAKSGDILILKLPPEKNKRPGVTLLSAGDARSLRFRAVPSDQLQFRNSEFIGPCFRE